MPKKENECTKAKVKKKKIIRDRNELQYIYQDYHNIYDDKKLIEEIWNNKTCNIQQYIIRYSSYKFIIRITGNFPFSKKAKFIFFSHFPAL